METQILNTREHVFHFYGDRKDRKDREDSNNLNNIKNKWPPRTLKIPDQTCYSVSNRDKICIGSESKALSVYIFDGLVNNDVIVLGKASHVVIRMCANTSFTFVQGTIGGIHIIKCSEIDIRCPIHNYVSIEYSNRVNILGQLDVNFLLYVSSSLDVSANGERYKSTAFTCTYYNSDGDILTSMRI